MDKGVWAIAEATKAILSRDMVRRRAEKAYVEGRLFCSRCLAPLAYVGNGAYRCRDRCQSVAERWAQAFRMEDKGWWFQCHIRCSRCRTHLLMLHKDGATKHWCPGCGPLGQA